MALLCSAVHAKPLLLCLSCMQTVLHITGCLEFSDPERTIKNCFGNALQSAVQHNLDHEVLSSEEVNKRFPGYHLPPQYKVLLPILLRSLPAVRDVTLTG